MLFALICKAEIMSSHIPRLICRMSFSLFLLIPCLIYKSFSILFFIVWKSLRSNSFFQSWIHFIPILTYKWVLNEFRKTPNKFSSPTQPVRTSHALLQSLPMLLSTGCFYSLSTVNFSAVQRQFFPNTWHFLFCLPGLLFFHVFILPTPHCLRHCLMVISTHFLVVTLLF